MNQPSFRDIELLSAYLDGQLSQADAARLESRIESDPELRSVYDDLRQSQALLRKLPARRAPRNFRLTPKMAGIKPPLPRAFPVFRLASALAAILFFLGYAVNLSSPAASIRTSAPFAYGIGSSAPAAVEMAAPAATDLPAPTSAPSVEPVEAPKFAPTQEPSLAAQDNYAQTPDPENTGASEPAQTEGAALSATPTELEQAEGTTLPDMARSSSNPAPVEPLTLPVHPAWLAGLLGLTVISGAMAFLVRARTERNWSKANAMKPAELGIKDILLIALTIVAVLLLAAGLFWMSTMAFYASAPQSMTYPSRPLGDDKDSKVLPTPQFIFLEPGLSYNFSTTDEAGLITAIDFPADAVKDEDIIDYQPGLDYIVPPGGTSFDNRAFTILFGSKGGVLQAPITITMNYSDNIASAVVDETSLILYWQFVHEWRDAATTCNPESTYKRTPETNQISISVCETGTFVLGVP